MLKNDLLEVLLKIAEISEQMELKLTLMGGIAFSIYARPRTTYDIDGIAALEENDIQDFLDNAQKKGFRFDKKNPVKSIRGLPFITLYHTKSKIYVDLFLAKSDFEKEILKRTKEVKYGKLRIHIISPEDLILIKLRTGRERDIEDVRELFLENKDKLNLKYLKKKAKELGIYIFLQDELKGLGFRL